MDHLSCKWMIPAIFFKSYNVLVFRITIFFFPQSFSPFHTSLLAFDRCRGDPGGAVEVDVARPAAPELAGGAHASGEEGHFYPVSGQGDREPTGAPPGPRPAEPATATGTVLSLSFLVHPQFPFAPCA